MASTQDIIKANLISLGFNNASTSALYNKVAESVGVTVDNTITEINNSENRIFNIINTQRYGKSGYYTSIAKAFQYGDDLIVDPVTLDFVYAAIDTTKQIISQAAFEEFTSGNSSLLYLKIATLNKTTGLLQSLPIAQYSAFKNYFVNFEIPGLPVTIINADGNILFFNAVTTYYATYDLPTLQKNLINALNTFRDSFDFNGEFFAGDLQAYIKSTVPGVRDFFVFNTTIDGMPFNGSQNLGSGYFNYINNIQNNITYVPV